MRLFVAEKPSLARSIASGLGEITKKGEYHIEVGSDFVTWCFGHILELAPPEAYDTRLSRWSLDSLPITVPGDGWKLVVRPDAKKQYDAIGALLRLADEVVNAGDPDREGQMLIDEVLEAHRWSGKTSRILIANTTPEGVRSAMKNIRPNSDFRPLYEAAMCRSRADWLVGMNFTRAATKRIGVITSVGRVQTPTLALVVKRDRAIEGHKSSVYYPLHAQVQTEQGSFIAVHDTEGQRITDLRLAKEIAESLSGKRVPVELTTKQERVNAPLPFVLSSFQSEAEDAYGWGAKESLDVLQSLYEKQWVTYPRTDCPYLPSEHAKFARRIAEAVVATGMMPQGSESLLPHMTPRPSVYDDAKVEEHHGIVPTSRMPPVNDIQPKLRQGWELVARRFLQSLLPALIKDVAEASFVHQERRFVSRGESPVNFAESWMVLERPKEKREGVPPLSLRGAINQGDVVRVEIKEGKTSPPKRYTEASLIADMKTVGKFVDDPRLKAILKETSGIGTASTHASIIETLKFRRYVNVVARGKTKQIVSTDLGRYLIDNLPGPLRDPGITAAWEDALNKIAKEGSDPGTFMSKVDAYVSRYIERMKSMEMSPLPPQAAPPPQGRRPATKKARKRAG